MADYVYDIDGDDGRGNLFEGKRFFFVQRLPTRDRWLNLVKANGGEIVKLEKQADIVIADHARQNKCPVGSISWKYIEHSVNAGQLKNTADYPAGPSVHTPRAVGSSQPSKKGRTPFTAEDDRILAKWVHKAEREGELTRGNQLYIDLEAQNSRHTAQSWRDRWIKYVSLRHPPDSEVESPGTSPGDSRPVAQAAPSNQRSPQYRRSNERAPSPRTNMGVRNQPQMPRSLTPPARPPKNRSVARSIAATKARDERSYIDQSTGGPSFTNEEIDLLENTGHDIMNLDEDQTINAWITWASVHPNHTAQEWRNCFAEVVAPRMLEKGKKQADKAPARSELKQDSAVQPRPSSSKQEPYRRATAPALPTSVSEVSNTQATTDNARPPILSELAFKKKLIGIAEGLKKKVIFNPVVCGRTVSLYKLWQLVQSEEFGGLNAVNERHMWPVVARKLNFSDFQHSNAPKELESFYVDILWILDVGHEEFELAEESESEQEMIEAQLLKTAARETQNPAEALDIEAGRESRESSYDLEMSSQPQSSRKRRRINKGKGGMREIPGTPERISDNDQVPHTSHRNPQVEAAAQRGIEDDEDENESDLFVQPFKKVSMSPMSSLSAAVRRIAEPETQDFHFPLEQHDEVQSVPSVPSSRPRKTKKESGNPAVPARVTECTSSPGQTQAQRDADLNSFVENYISLGYRGDHVLLALEATTMNTGDAGIVMEALRDGNGVPKNIQGVWTSSDDEAVDEDEHPNFSAVVEKHGMDRLELRRRFLADQRAAKDQLS